jgi:transposase InsO family protein
MPRRYPPEVRRQVVELARSARRIHSDRGVQFTSWSFSQNVRAAGLAPSIGAIGCPYDNAVVEAFWGRMQVELLNRKSWKTRIELASAIHDYIELFHNNRRRHSALGRLTRTEYEDRYFHTHNAAWITV